MSGTARAFFASAIIYGLVGMVMGLVMAIEQDHSQRPTHAHVMVIGWISFFLFALFYERFGDRVAGRWARLHLWSAQLSAIVLFAALWILYAGNEQFDPVAAVSAIVYALSFVAFALAALPVIRARS